MTEEMGNIIYLVFKYIKCDQLKYMDDRDNRLIFYTGDHTIRLKIPKEFSEKLGKPIIHYWSGGFIVDL